MQKSFPGKVKAVGVFDVLGGKVRAFPADQLVAREVEGQCPIRLAEKATSMWTNMFVGTVTGLGHGVFGKLCLAGRTE